jgi:hypothetical protein
MEKIRKGNVLTSPVSFTDIEAAIKEDDPGKTSHLMAAFLQQKGGKEFARRLLLLGSGYLNNSLGHSVSCTALILLEMIEQTDRLQRRCRLCKLLLQGRFHHSVPKTASSFK